MMIQLFSLTNQRFFFLSLTLFLLGTLSFAQTTSEHGSSYIQLINDADKNTALPLVHDKTNLLIANKAGQLFVLNTKTNTITLQLNVDFQLATSPIANQKAFFFTTQQGEIVALSKTGNFLWRKSLQDIVDTTPTLAENQLLVKTISGKIIALNLENGHINWTYQLSEQPPLSLKIPGLIQIVDDLVIAGFANGQLMALDLETGKRHWQYQLAMPSGLSELEEMTGIYNAFIISKKEGVIYVGSYQGNLAAVMLWSGKPIWEIPFSTTQPLALTHDTVIATSDTGKLTAFSRKTGKKQWEVGVHSTHLTGAVAFNNQLAVADYQGNLHLFNLKGKLLHTYPIEETIHQSPISYDNKLYLLTDTMQLITYRG